MTPIRIIAYRRCNNQTPERLGPRETATRNADELLLILCPGTPSGKGPKAPLRLIQGSKSA
jgi:hypothetical protein